MKKMKLKKLQVFRDSSFISHFQTILTNSLLWKVSRTYPHLLIFIYDYQFIFLLY